MFKQLAPLFLPVFYYQQLSLLSLSLSLSLSILKVSEFPSKFVYFVRKGRVKMSSESNSLAAEEVEVNELERHCQGKSKGKVPKKIHKSEREKLKREHLNELFLDLESALELSQTNNGKASILSEATRFLKEFYGQIESLKQENTSLISESQYVTIENNELKEENSALETQIETLQSELQARVAQSKPDLNMPPSNYQSEMPHALEGSVMFPAADSTLPQAPPPAVFVVPFHPDLESYHVPSSHVSKPHARYPTPADSWPSQLLGDQLTSSKAVQCSDNNRE